MKIQSISTKNRLRFVVVIAATGLFALGFTRWPSTSYAADLTSTTITAQEIAAQELDLQQKQLEFDKAKLEVQKTDALELRKTKLEIEIKKLELLKARRDLMIVENEKQLNMLVEGDVLFDVNSYAIKTGAAPALRQVALILTEYPTGKVMVTGFADSTGNPQDNLELSRKRGESVKTYLLEKSAGAISSERVVAEGKGETKPVATNTSSAGRQLNRRVEITISKL